jgi:hypothetical protein
MRVLDAEGRFVGFAKEIENQMLVIGRPSAGDIEVPLGACHMCVDRVELSLLAHEIEQVGRPGQVQWDLQRPGR